MPVPPEKEIRRPLLEAVRGEAPQSFSINDFLKIIAEHFGEDLIEMSSIDKNALKSRINDAKTYLRVHKLLSNPSKQTYMLTKTGAEILDKTSGIIDDECIKSLSSPQIELAPPEPEPEPELQTPEPEPEADSPVPELPELSDTEPEIQQEDSEPEDEPEIHEEPEETYEVPEDPGKPEEPEETEELQNLPDDIDMTANYENGEDGQEIIDEPVDESEPEAEESEPEIEPEPESDSEEEYTDETIGEDDMPDESFADEEELTEDYPDAAVIQSQSIDDVISRHNSDLADRVLMRVSGLSSDTFEVFVIDLLSKMGYRAFQNARYTNDSSDNGMIQGVILDAQGTVPVYIHAKKLSPGRTVGRADVQDFVDALADKGGKGIFATTGTFSENAVTYAQDERIMLIDGTKLAGLMIAHNFCVNVEKVVEVKELDEDSFNEYEN